MHFYLYLAKKMLNDHTRNGVTVNPLVGECALVSHRLVHSHTLTPAHPRPSSMMSWPLRSSHSPYRTHPRRS